MVSKKIICLNTALLAALDFHEIPITEYILKLETGTLDEKISRIDIGRSAEITAKLVHQTSVDFETKLTSMLDYYMLRVRSDGEDEILEALDNVKVIGNYYVVCLKPLDEDHQPVTENKILSEIVLMEERLNFLELKTSALLVNFILTYSISLNKV